VDLGSFDGNSIMGKLSKVWRWGIMATGKIADLFSQDLALSDRAEIYAVASREHHKSQDFAKPRANRPIPIQKAYGNYEAMANDPNVDIIYIATPHSHHFEAICLCLNAGKHVVCEKPITLESDSKLIFSQSS